MSRIRTSAAAVAIAGLCLASTAWAGDDDDKKKKSLTIGDKAPTIDIAHWVKGLKTDDKGRVVGKPITEFGDGKVYVLEFWATWCGPCKMGMPHLSKLQEKYNDYDVKIIGISDEPLQKVVGFLFTKDRSDGKVQNERTNYTLTTDPDESVKKDYFKAAGRTGIPSAFIIGKDGHVEWIGHPAEMDAPLEAVVHDKWDRDEYKRNTARKAKAQKKLQAAYREGDWDTVVELLEGQIKADPSDTGTMMRLFQVTLTETHDHETGYAVAEKLVKEDWDNKQTLNAVAWLIVDDKRVEERNLDFALKVAKRANELTDSTDGAILDTLARVYYEKGDLKSAIKWQQKAVEHAPNGAMAEGIKKMLDKYLKEAGEI